MNFIQTTLTTAVREGISRTVVSFAGYAVIIWASSLAYIALVVLVAWLVADRYGPVAGLATAAAIFACTALGAWVFLNARVAAQKAEEEARKAAAKTEEAARAAARASGAGRAELPGSGFGADLGLNLGGDRTTAVVALAVGAAVFFGPMRVLGLAARAYSAWTLSRPLRQALAERVASRMGSGS